MEKFNLGDKAYKVEGYYGIKEVEIDIIRPYNTFYKYGIKGSDFMYNLDDFKKTKNEAIEELCKNIINEKQRLYNNYETDIKKLDNTLKKYLGNNL